MSNVAKQTARLNARAARRLGWKASDIVVTHDDLAEVHTVTVAGREFDMTRPRLAKKVSAGLNLQFKPTPSGFKIKMPDGHVVKTSAATKRELAFVLLSFVAHTPRRQLREFRAG